MKLTGSQSRTTLRKVGKRKKRFKEVQKGTTLFQILSQNSSFLFLFFSLSLSFLFSFTEGISTQLGFLGTCSQHRASDVSANERRSPGSCLQLVTLKESKNLFRYFIFFPITSCKKKVFYFSYFIFRPL